MATGQVKQLKFLTNKEYVATVNKNFLEFLKTDSYEIFAISYDADRTDPGLKTKFDRWFTTKNLYLSKYQSGKNNPQYIDSIAIEKNKTGSCLEASTDILPAWIKNNAKWWSENKISDSDFVSAIQYLIKNKIVVMPESQSTVTVTQEKIPYWIKHNAEWRADGNIRESEFIQSIQYLISMEIIKIDS